VLIAIWQDPGQAGKAQAHALTARLSRLGFTVRTITTSQNKEGFARVWAPEVQQGRCDLVAGPWNATYTREAQAFPSGRYDDQVDATSLGWQALTKHAPVRSFHIRGL
jgi:predicted phage terminase large subunit-like protein